MTTTTIVDLHVDTKTEEDVIRHCHTLQNLSLNFRANRAEIRRAAAEVLALTNDEP